MARIGSRALIVSAPERWPKRPLPSLNRSASTSATTGASSSSGLAPATAFQSASTDCRLCSSQARSPPSPNRAASCSLRPPTQSATLRACPSQARLWRSCRSSASQRPCCSRLPAIVSGAVSAGASPGVSGSTRPSTSRSIAQLRLWRGSPPRARPSRPQRKPQRCSSAVISPASLGSMPWWISWGAQPSTASRAVAVSRFPASCNRASRSWLMPATLCWLRSVRRQGSATPVASLSPNTAPTSGAKASTWGVITRMSRGSSSGSVASSCRSRSRTICSWRSRPGQAWNSREWSVGARCRDWSVSPVASRSCSCSSSVGARPRAALAGRKKTSWLCPWAGWVWQLASSSCWNSAPSRPKRASSPGTSSSQSLPRGSPALASWRCQRSRQGVSR